MAMYVETCLNWLVTPNRNRVQDKEVFVVSGTIARVLENCGETLWVPNAPMKLISTRPRKPAWAYTCLENVLTQLGVDPTAPTRYGFSESPTHDPFVDIRTSNAEQHYMSGTKTMMIVDHLSENIVGKIMHNADTKQTHVFMDNEYLSRNPNEFSLFHPFGQKGTYERALNFALADRRERIRREKTDLERRLSSVTAKLAAVPEAIQSLLPNPKVLGASQDRHYIYLWLDDLRCFVEDKMFFLGKTILKIEKNNWDRVFAFATEPRAISHPHSTYDGVCLGRQFNEIARELQDRGLWGMYVNLLIEHLENGVDQTDSAGIRVLSLPEVGAQAEPVAPQAELPLNTEVPPTQVPPVAPTWVTEMPSEIPGVRFVLRGNMWEMVTVRQEEEEEEEDEDNDDDDDYDEDEEDRW